ncbi:MAG: hypothetical protein EA376_13895 [Phycisphaeraceae bacterium]|nr:MAG: hypothetical protein EA376_13895 [Phycisphaeraceae bacterium]
MPYTLFEHRHRFAIWAAARAAQRGFTSVRVLRDALESTDIAAFLRDPASLETDQAAFDGRYRGWCIAALGFLENAGVANSTFGRVAKLVAVYLKSMVITGPHAESRLAGVIHPPIDAILLKNLARSEAGSQFPQRWRTMRWTMLDEQAYSTLIAELRRVLPEGEPFWKLEEHWTITSG